MPKAKDPPHDTTSVPTAGSLPLIGNDPPMPVAPRAMQEKAFFALRRVRRNIADLPLSCREWIGGSIVADCDEDKAESSKTAASNGSSSGSQDYKETDEL